MSGEIKTFLQPNLAKFFASIIVFLYLFYSILGPDFSFLSGLLISPLMLTGSFAMILIFPYSYLIGCIIANGVDMIKHKKLLLAITASVFILIAGLDEPLMNNTINKPDYSCITDNDCTEKLIHKVQCGRYQCVNSKWEYYDSMINRAFATSCRNTPYSCSCVENKCQTIEKDQMPE